MIEVKSDCEHDKFGYIPIEDSSFLQKNIRFACSG